MLRWSLLLPLPLLFLLGCNDPGRGPGPNRGDDDTADDDTADDDDSVGDDDATGDDDDDSVGDDDDATFSIPPGDPNFTTAHSLGSGNCSPCHEDLVAPDGSDASFLADWGATMMGNAARDPYFRARLASEVVRNPDAAPVIEAKCARCHTPMGSVQDLADGGDGTLLDDGLLDPAHPLFDAAIEGVSCTVCHRIEDTSDLGTAAGSSGSYTILPNDRIYGPFLDPVTGPMANNLGVQVLGSAHQQDSSLCSVCHDLATPVLGADGLPTGAEFQEQAIYSEWAASDFAGQSSCQDCHMPAVDGMDAASRPPWIEPRDDVNRHWFVGGNTLMLGILRDNAAALGATSQGFGTTIDRTRANLQSSAQVTIQAPSRNGGQLDFDVRVTSATGHKLPAGYPTRRVWLHVQVDDGNGIVWESGAPATNGAIAGLDQDSDPLTVEPHHPEITDASQVQVWEAVAEDTSGDAEYSLMRSAAYRKDNRILPAGADPSSGPDAVRPVGAAASDPDFLGGEDTVRFRLDGLPSSGTLTVTVTLRYQTLSYVAVEDLRQDASDPTVAAFLALYDVSPDRAGEVIGQATLAL